MQWESGPRRASRAARRGCPSSTQRVRNIADERSDAGSLLSLYRQLLELRRRLGRGFRLLDAERGVVAYERDGHVVAVNTTAEPRTAPEGRARARDPLTATVFLRTRL
jgi:hypothetical protein